MDIDRKLQLLRQEFRQAGKVILAFSGGVDSSLLAAIGRQELGENLYAVTVDNGLQSRHDLESACRVAEYCGLRHSVLQMDVLQEKAIRENTPRRCYLCKKILLSGLLHKAAAEEAFVMEGSHAEDGMQHRPGRKAIEELGIMSPLQKAGFEKREIRELARELGLPNWDAPANPCLATRFSCGQILTPQLLQRVEEAESILRRSGFREFRVRCHGDLARIEVGVGERQRFIDLDFMDKIEQEMRQLGFLHTALDLRGYRTGSMEECQDNEGGIPDAKG